MTPNGAAVFALLTIAAAMAANLRGLATLCFIAAALRRHRSFAAPR